MSVISNAFAATLRWVLIGAQARRSYSLHISALLLLRRPQRIAIRYSPSQMSRQRLTQTPKSSTAERRKPSDL
jgi:hypothetical protein